LSSARAQPRPLALVPPADSRRRLGAVHHAAGLRLGRPWPVPRFAVRPAQSSGSDNGPGGRVQGAAGPAPDHVLILWRGVANRSDSVSRSAC
jgi:hypothetical protein